MKNVVLTEVIAEIVEHDDIATTKSDEARHTSGQMIKMVVNKPAI